MSEENEEEEENAEKKIRKIVREEISSTMPGILKDWKFEVEYKHPEEEHATPKTEECEGCGAKIKGKPKYCPDCGGEFDWQ